MSHWVESAQQRDGDEEADERVAAAGLEARAAELEAEKSKPATDREPSPVAARHFRRSGELVSRSQFADHSTASQPVWDVKRVCELGDHGIRPTTWDDLAIVDH